MREQHYILHHGHPVPEPDLVRWARWMETRREERTVVLDVLGSGTRVSTVFLALDHSFGLGEPQLYETMVFNGPLDGEQDRYATLDEAEAGHAAILAQVQATEEHEER